jgi:hypothetical protein
MCQGRGKFKHDTGIRPFPVSFLGNQTMRAGVA